MNSGRNQSKAAARSSLRIIGGQWRGRRLTFAAGGVRPTGDRIRETLFNWLDPYIRGARCLDWFAGSGALGIEALSRGAAACVFVEQNRAAGSLIREHLRTLQADGGKVICADGTRIDLAAEGPFGIVFLDPPFDSADPGKLCTLLESSGALAADARIYIESARSDSEPELPANWVYDRQRATGQVRYALARRQG